MIRTMEGFIYREQKRKKEKWNLYLKEITLALKLLLRCWLQVREKETWAPKAYIIKLVQNKVSRIFNGTQIKIILCCMYILDLYDTLLLIIVQY